MQVAQELVARSDAQRQVTHGTAGQVTNDLPGDSTKRLIPLTEPRTHPTPIVLITGGPAFGKTTIARRVAEHLRKSIHVRVDDLREMMVSGVELPTHGWTNEATRQFQLARSTASHMAQLYANEGVAAVIDDVCVPPEFARQYAELFSNPAVRRVLLLPTSTALVERLRKRAGPYDAFLTEHVPWIYSYLEPMPKDGWIVLDSSDWTVEHTVDEVLRRIEFEQPA